METQNQSAIVKTLLEEGRYEKAYISSVQNFYDSLFDQDKNFCPKDNCESEADKEDIVTALMTVMVFKTAASKNRFNRASYIYLKIDLILSLYFTERYKEASEVFYTMDYYFQNLVHEKYRSILEKQKLEKEESNDRLIRFCINMKKYHPEREDFFHYKLGCIYKDNGDNEKAIEYFYKAAMCDSEDPNNYLKISGIYDKLKLTRNAIDALRLSINMSSPYYAEKYMDLTRLLIVAGRYLEAKEVILVATKYSEYEPGCHMLLSLIYLLELNEDEYHKKILSMPEEQRKDAIVYVIDSCKTMKQYEALKLLLWSKRKYLKSIYSSELMQARDAFSGSAYSLDKEDLEKKLKTCFLLDFENNKLGALSSITKKTAKHIIKNKTEIPNEEYGAYALIERSQYKQAIKYFHAMDAVNTESIRIKIHAFSCEYLMGERRRALNRIKNFSLLHQREALETLVKYAMRVEDFNAAKYILIKLNKLIPKNLEIKLLENLTYSISRKKNIKIAYNNFKKFLQINWRSEVFYKKLSACLTDIYYNTKYIGSFISHMQNVEKKFTSYIRRHNIQDEGPIGVIGFIKILISMTSGIVSATGSNSDEMLDKILEIKSLDSKFKPEDVYEGAEEISYNMILDKVFVLKDKGRQLGELKNKCRPKKMDKSSEQLKTLQSEIKSLERELSRIILRHTRIFTYTELENIKTAKTLEKNNTSYDSASKGAILAPNKEGFVFCPTKSIEKHKNKVKFSDSNINNLDLEIEIDEPVSSKYDLLYYVREGSRYVLDYKNSFIFTKVESNIPKQITDNYFWFYNTQKSYAESGIKEKNTKAGYSASNIGSVNKFV